MVDEKTKLISEIKSKSSKLYEEHEAEMNSKEFWKSFWADLLDIQAILNLAPLEALEIKDLKRLKVKLDKIVKQTKTCNK